MIFNYNVKDKCSNSDFDLNEKKFNHGGNFLYKIIIKLIPPEL